PGVSGDRVTAGQYLLWPQQAQTGLEQLATVVQLCELPSGVIAQVLSELLKCLPPLLQHEDRTQPGQALRQVPPGQTLLPRALFDAAQHGRAQIVQELQPLVRAPARMQTAEPLRELGQIVVPIRQLLADQLSKPGRRLRQGLAARENAFGN